MVFEQVPQDIIGAIHRSLPLRSGCEGCKPPGRCIGISTLPYSLPHSMDYYPIRFHRADWPLLRQMIFFCFCNCLNTIRIISLLTALGQHSPFPLPGRRLGCELLHYFEVAGASLLPFSSFRLIGQSCIPHTHSTFVGCSSIITSLLFTLSASLKS